MSTSNSGSSFRRWTPRFIFATFCGRSIAEGLRNSGVVEALDRLYFNAKTGRPKRGATTESRPGSVRRFIALMRQLEVNFDLYALGANEILDLLPAEFDAWR